LTNASQWLTDGAKRVGLSTLALLGARYALMIPCDTVPDEADLPVTQTAFSFDPSGWLVTGFVPTAML